MWFRRKRDKDKVDSAAPRRPSSGATTQRVRLPVDLLETGMRIVKLDRPWTEVPVLFQGFTLESEEQAGILRHYCDWVLVEDEEDRLDTALDKEAQRAKATTEPLPETRPLAEELPQARKTWTQTQQFVEQLSQSIEQGDDLRLEAARPLIRSCVESIKANPGALFWMSRIKSRDAYTAEHCLRVAIFSAAFARFLGMPDDDLEVAGLCGLLHDVGKLRVPSEILNKPGPLSAEETRVMQHHTIFGHELLSGDPRLDPIIIDVTRHHHERIDGRGYPLQLSEWQISRFARLIAIVDAFDAITSDRCYRDGLPASDALRILYRNRGQQFDASMVESFIRMIGIYPAGTLVELSSGEVGLVIAAHPGKKLRPKLEILLDADKQPVEPRIVDLATLSGEPPLEIARPLPDGAFGMSVKGRIKQLAEDPHSVKV